MEYTIKIKDKKVYESLVHFLKSLGIMINASPEKSENIIENKKEHNSHFKAIKLHTKGMKFNREEANER
jgi:hypothetical protein